MPHSKPLNLLDLSFVLMETRQTPMHVAGLQTFVPPAGAPRDFPRQVYEYLRSFPVTASSMGATRSRSIANPAVQGNPAAGLRSLMAIGIPNSGGRVRGSVVVSCSVCWVARARADVAATLK